MRQERGYGIEPFDARGSTRKVEYLVGQRIAPDGGLEVGQPRKHSLDLMNPHEEVCSKI
jgi:hypothetical protein